MELEEVIKNLELLQAKVEWEEPLDRYIALEEAIYRLKKALSLEKPNDKRMGG